MTFSFRLLPDQGLGRTDMMQCYRFADKTISLCTLYPEIHTLCADYRAEGASVFSVETTRADIAFEREKSAREARAEGKAVRAFSDAYLETLAVYRKIAEKMPDYDTLLFHGSCVAVDGAAYCFTAKSGTGKSTHTRLWRETLGERAMMINDDKPLIRIRDGKATVFGTPWDGKHHLSANRAAPLKVICILERSAYNHIEPVTAAEAYPLLLRQAYRPADPAALGKTLALLDRLAASVKLYRLGCNMDPGAAELSYGVMKEGKTNETE